MNIKQLLESHFLRMVIKIRKESIHKKMWKKCRLQNFKMRNIEHSTLNKSENVHWKITIYRKMYIKGQDVMIFKLFAYLILITFVQ